MFKQTCLIPLFIIVLLFMFVGDRCLADVTEQLNQARGYQDNGYITQAEGIYETIVTQNPGSDSALEAQKQLVFVELQKQSKLPGSANPEAELDKLMMNFAGNTKLPEALYEVAAEYERLMKYQKAKQLYQLITQQHTNSPEAAKAVVDVSKTDILELIKSGQADAAQKAINSFIAQYSGGEYVADALNDVAYFWRRFKNYTKAVELYQYVADTWPNNPDAMWAQMGVAKSNVEGYNFAAANIATEKLLSNYKSHPELATAIHYLARRYRKENKYDEAKALYQQILNRFPGTSDADNASIEIAKMDILNYINSGGFTEAKTATNKLINDFSGHLNLARMLYEIPFEYERLGRYSDAKDICRKIIENCPDHFRAQKAAMDIRRYDIFVLIDSGQYDKVSTEIDKLVNDYSSQPYLPEVISQLAKHYCTRASQLDEQGLSQQANDYLNNAASLYDKVITQFGGSLEAPAACLAAGDSCSKSGRYEKSNQYYQKVLDDYSDYYLTWQAQFMIGRNYEAMGEAQIISKDTAKANASSAYEQLLAKYPDCKAIGYAKKWLGR